MSVDLLITAFVSRGAGSLVRDLDRVGASIGRVEAANARMSRIGNTMSVVGAAAAFGLAKLGQASIKAASDAQATRVAYTTLLGSGSKAASLYKDIQKFSLLSPFNNAEVAKSSIALLGTGLAADKVIPRLHAVGNAVASIGGNTEKFNGVNAILNKMSLRSKVSSVQLNQLALRGINPFKILQQELGLTADQVANIGKTGLKGSVVVEALVRGFEKIGGGKSMERLNKTFAGQVGQFEDAKDQLFAAGGEIILPDATRFISGLASATSNLRDLTREHPRLTRVGLAIGVIGSTGLIVGGQLLKLRNILATTGAAKAILDAATRKTAQANVAATLAQNAETAAEARKIPVAYAQSAAMGALTASVGRTAAANGALALSGGASALRAPLALPGPTLANAIPKGGIGSGAGNALVQWLNAPLRAGLNNSFGQPVARASALSGAVLGVGAGIGSRNDLKALGYSDARANTQGIATGIGTAVLTTLVPPARLLTIAAEALRAGVTQFYNKPMERAAQAGTGAQSDFKRRLSEAQKSGDYRGQQRIYNQMASEAYAKGDETSATSFRLSALGLGKRAARAGRPGSPEYMARQRAEAAQFAKEHPPMTSEEADRANRRQAEMGASAYDKMSPTQRASVAREAQARTRRDGTATSTITVTVNHPQTAGNQLARSLAFNRMTPRIA